MTNAIDRRALLAIGTLLAAGATVPATAEDESEADHMRSMMK